MNGTDLLAEFRKSRADGAFGELVRRYTNLVYSVAKRRLGNVSLAEEVTQSVFLRLAKAAPNLRGDAELAAWLHPHHCPCFHRPVALRSPPARPRATRRRYAT